MASYMMQLKTNPPQITQRLYPVVSSCSPLLFGPVLLMLAPQPQHPHGPRYSSSVTSSRVTPPGLCSCLPSVWNTLSLDIHFDFSFISFRYLLKRHYWSEARPSPPITNYICRTSYSPYCFIFSSEHTSPSSIYCMFIFSIFLPTEK